MILLILAYLGGVLTIVSPCILPVLPFVFARADRPFRRSGLPLLAGMAVTFAAVATLAAVAGGWAVDANKYGRLVAMIVLAFFGVTLLVPALADKLTRPLVTLGARLSASANTGTGANGPSTTSSLLLGVATGLLWAPCAGPVLGLILTGAALGGASARTTALLLAFAAGAATSLALVLAVGGRVFAAMKRSLGASEWIRRALGAAVLAGVACIAMGLDTGLLTRLSLASTSSLEQGLIDRLHPAAATAGAKATAVAQAGAVRGVGALPVEGEMPSLDGATTWFNSPPLTTAGLRGKVVLVDFWTYSCINCLRALPYVEAWAKKYKDQGLVVIGVHAPEFAFEKDTNNVRKAIADLGVTYPVAVDNNRAIWRAFNNEYWPAHYFIGAQGRIRHHHFGEGDYDGSERVIQQLLAEAGDHGVPHDTVAVAASGVEAAPDLLDVQSPETYVGYARAQGFTSPGSVVSDSAHTYTPGHQDLNGWGLAGNWTVHADYATLNRSGGAIVYRFHARDLHLVLGPEPDGKPVRFRVTIDGAPPGEDRGVDTNAAGFGTVKEQRLYQLVRQAGDITDRTFEITFLDPGVQAFSFTFG
jgi:cytochrome c biogenesis protein CcdA/thiol-disulfide isomerase/thioredoxin